MICSILSLRRHFWHDVPFLAMPFWCGIPCAAVIRNAKSTSRFAIGEAYDVVFGIHLMIGEVLRRHFGVNSMYPLGRLFYTIITRLHISK